MRRVEAEPAMTALFADHRVLTVSTSTPSLTSTAAASTLSVPFAPSVIVSIIRLSAVVLLASLLALISLVLSSPAVSRIRGGAGLTPIDTRMITLGG